MPTRTNQNVKVRAGETRPIQMTILDETGAHLDVAGETLVYRIAKHGRMTPPHYIVDIDQTSLQLTVEDNGHGVFSIVRFDPGLDDLILPGKHTHALAVIQSGSDARVVLEGTFEILPSVTHPR